MDYYNQVFDQPESLPEQWAHQEFEACTFRKVNLAQAAFVQTNFINCRFEGCNLSKAVLKHTKLHDVFFLACQLTHVDFSPCNAFAFGVGFQDCQLDYTVFLKRNLKKTRFIGCSLKEAHFLKCDLTGAVYKDCNLELARFGENNLTQADFSTSFNLRLNLDANTVKKARFSLHNLPGLLEKYDLVIRE